MITHFQPQATRFYNSQFLSVGRFVKILKLEGSIIQYHEKLDVENPKFILPALNVITKHSTSLLYTHALFYRKRQFLLKAAAFSEVTLALC